MIETSIDTNSSSITLTSLEPLNEYNISVVALSEHISSEPITSSIFLGEFIFVLCYVMLCVFIYLHI